MGTFLPFLSFSFHSSHQRSGHIIHITLSYLLMVQNNLHYNTDITFNISVITCYLLKEKVVTFLLSKFNIKQKKTKNSIHTCFVQICMWIRAPVISFSMTQCLFKGRYNYTPKPLYLYIPKLDLYIPWHILSEFTVAYINTSKICKGSCSPLGTDH